MSNNLLKRIAFAGVAIPLTILIIWQGGWLLAALLALLGVLGTREVYDLARRQGVAALTSPGYLAAAMIPLATYWAKGSELHWAEPAIFAGAMWMLLVLGAALTSRGPGERPLGAVAVTVFGALYASALPAFLIAIRHGADAPERNWPFAWLVLFPLALTWICDTAAMAAGTTIGGRKLAPVVSPNKTWAGAVGGLRGAVAGSFVIGELVLPRFGWHLYVWELLAMGTMVGLLAQVGDVAESLFKREAGVKDSSSLIPGHGGVLDRLDSLYFVLPAAAGLLKLFGLI
jgi:phosphatidate cytidylyltransferase